MNFNRARPVQYHQRHASTIGDMMQNQSIALFISLFFGTALTTGCTDPGPDASTSAAAPAPTAAETNESANTPTTQPNAWTFETGTASVELEQNEEFIVASGMQSPEAVVSNAELVFVGYGIRAPEYDEFEATRKAALEAVD